MNIKKKIGLEGVRFFAYHGFYPEEQILGNEFIVDIITEMDVLSDGDDELANTVNYERLFEIAALQMKKTQKLLETVAIGILNTIKEEFPSLDTIRISIRKTRLPLEGEINNSLVEFTYRK
ncbi:dihydroneopterin aldolase [Arcticibacter tournemirensis]|uniref:7,8-dihydroneopterin aldolase n=1 Tax=Arcticibacter tournemirensis TaxID=699437 RepID=A0A5M9H0D5_9SPHI|nr:dihydroneopterin aldolase [Arcticibacter tournemirensis]KAA8478528.1 dihydroneopterin aldolase [Arcticibacter tournemirensis]TQM51124.1 dihydroneopterin aldolase [Arcticibacter tournemirensis]